MTFRLVVPGRNSQRLESADDTTLADVVSQFEIYEMDLFVNGTRVDRAAYTTTVVPDGAQIMATVPTKGA